MTRPRAISLSSTSGDEVRELTSEEVARLASRPGRPAARRRRAPPNRPADAEVIVISDSDSPVRDPPNFQARLARARGSGAHRRPAFAGADALGNIERQIRLIEERDAELVRQEQMLESLPVYAALGLNIAPRPVIRRHHHHNAAFARRTPARRMPAGRDVSFAVEAGRLALQRVLFMPRFNDALDSMSYDELLELGRRVGNVRQRGADPKRISKLQKRKWKGLKTTLPASSELHGCAICIEDFVDSDNVCILECKHMFHTGCSKKWLQVNATCPVCRASIDGTPAVS